MKSISVLALTAVLFGTATAQTFSNSNWSTTLSNVGATTTDKSSCYTLNLRNFELNANNTSAGLTWNFDFDAGALPFASVDFTIYGTVTAASPGWTSKLDIFASEQVFNTAGASSSLAGSGFIVTSVSVLGTANFPDMQAFTATVSIPLWPNVKKGSVSKDMFFSLTGFGTGGGSGVIGSARIDAIEQCFTPVPEPATMATLGLGAAFLARKRRKK